MNVLNRVFLLDDSNKFNVCYALIVLRHDMDIRCGVGSWMHGGCCLNGYLCLNQYINADLTPEGHT